MALFNPAAPYASSSDRLRAWVGFLFVGVFLVLALLLGGALWLGRDFTIRAAQGRAENLTLILANHLERTTAAIDTTLAQLALHSARVGGPKASSDTWDPVLASTLSGLAGERRGQH